MLRKVLLLISCAFCVCKASIAQTEWENTFGLPDSSFALDMIQVQDGDFVLYGGTNAFTENSNAFLLKFKENGDLVWLENLDFNVHPYEGTLIEASNGDLIVCGEKIMRCNDMGNEIWTLNQASTEIDESSDGELFSVHYNQVFKISSSGQIIDSDSIGISLNSFRDTMNYAFQYELSTESVSYSSIKVINDSLLAIGGIQMGNYFLLNSYGPVTQYLKKSDFSTVKIIQKYFDSIISEAEFALLGFDFIQLNNSSTSEIFAICPSIPLSHLVQKSIVNEDSIFGSFTFEETAFCDPFDYFVSEDSALLMRFAKLKYDSFGFYGIAPWSPFEFSYESCSFFNFDEQGCYFSEGIKFGDPAYGDEINHCLYIENGRYLVAGVYDYYEGALPTQTPSRKFCVALVNIDPEPCSSELFENPPAGLFEQQITNTTRLLWDHYSYKTDACILRGGPIDGSNSNSPFLQNPGNLLVQGNNVAGDLDGFDFSGAFASDAQFTLFNPTLYPNGATADLIPGAFYKWKVRCGCLVDPTLPLPQRLQGSNVVLSPWSEWDVFQNLD